MRKMRQKQLIMKNPKAAISRKRKRNLSSKEAKRRKRMAMKGLAFKYSNFVIFPCFFHLQRLFEGSKGPSWLFTLTGLFCENSDGRWEKGECGEALHFGNVRR